MPYEVKITTTSDVVANVTLDNVWHLPTGIYSLEYVPDMMPAEWVKGALDFSPEPKHTLQLLASGSNNKALNPISEDIIRAVAADLKLERSNDSPHDPQCVQRCGHPSSTRALQLVLSCVPIPVRFAYYKHYCNR